MTEVERGPEDNKRKHLRINAAHPARIKTDGIESFSCCIKDFCRTGFFVEFDLESNPNKAIILSSLNVSVEASIDFTIAGRLGEKYTISGKIVRLTENGAGLFSSEMALNAYEALYMMNVESAELLDQNLQLSEKSASQLRKKCKQSFVTFIESSTEQFFDQMSSIIVKEGNSASFTEQATYTFALNTLKEKKDEFTAGYEAALNTSLLVAEQGQGDTQNTIDVPLDELSLVDKDDFEIWLKISKIVSKLENKFTLLLSKIAKRYQLISEINIDRKTNPFGPEILCRELSSQIGQLSLPQPIEDLLNAYIAEHLFEVLPAFYDEIAANLTPLSSLASSQEGAQANQKNTSRNDKTPDDLNKQEEQKEEFLNSNESSLDPVNSDTPSLEEYLELPEVQNEENASQTGTPDRRYDEIAHLSQEILKKSSSDMPLMPVSQHQGLQRPSALNSFPSNVNSNSAGSGLSSGNPVSDFLSSRPPNDSGVAAAQPAEIERSGFSLLSKLRNTSNSIGNYPAQIASNDVVEGRTSSENLPQIFTQDSPVATEFFQQVNQLPKYDARLAKNGDARLQAALSQQIDSLPAADRMQAQSLVRFIDRATEDFTPESQLAALINQLDTTLLKLALKDPAFLDSPEHEARQVVDILGEYHISESDEGQFLDETIHQFLGLQVDRVLENSEHDPSVYSEAKTTMAPVLEKARRAREIRVSSFQQSAEGRDRVRCARDRVNQGLNNILSERMVPEVIVHLLNSGWRQAINLLAIRHDSDELVKAQFDILDLLVRHYDGEEVEWPILVDQMMLLRDTLTQLCISTSDFEGLFDHLWKSTLSNDSKSLSRIHVGTLNTTQTQPIAADVKQFSNQFLIGDWWKFELVPKAQNTAGSIEDVKTIYMQLTWVSESRSRYAFVNRSATNKKEYKSVDLFNLFNEGKLSPMGINSTIFERVETRLLDEEYEKVSKQSVVNSVTDLPNRAGFMQALASSSLHSVHSHAVLICEFDQFRMINNNSGTDAADQAYRELAQKIALQLGEQDLLASFKDDTFAILKYDCDIEEAEKTAKLLVENLKDYKFQYEGKSYLLGLNIGFGEFHPATQLSSDAVRKIDSACLAAKDLGRNEAKAYTDSDAQLNEEIIVMDWAGRLDQIFSDDSLYLRCQMVLPINADPDTLPYYEILLGVQDSHTGTELQPGWFVSAVEKYGRAVDLDKWVIDNAFDWIAQNLKSFEQTGGFGINLSAISLGSDDLLEFLIAKLKNTKCSPEKICFEITETVAISNYAQARRFIKKIRQFGCRFCIDDFGSGFASYSYLKNMNTQILKIDGSFIRDLSKNEDDLHIVESMRDIAKSLGMKTVAEYVENPSTLSILKKLGIDYGQGYTIHRPEPLSNIVF